MTSATNADGVTYNYGRRTVEATSGTSTHEEENGQAGIKSASKTFNYSDLVAATAVALVDLPAGARVLSVALYVEETFAGTGGTPALEIGDGSTAAGYITAASGFGLASGLIAGFTARMNGVYSYGATDTAALEMKVYASADTIDVTASATTVWTAGKAVLTVNYL